MKLTDTDYVIRRCASLRAMNTEVRNDRERIRMIMNGGVEGIKAVMAWDYGKGSSMSASQIKDAYGVDMPTVNLLQTGLERTAQKVGKIPTLKAPNADDSAQRRRLEKRTSIIRGWDWAQRFELQFPQIGRWLPGYGHIMWKISTGRYQDTPYPKATLRDPYDVYPGYFGVEQQPEEAAVVRKVPLYMLRRMYPEAAWSDIDQRLMANRGLDKKKGVVLGGTGSTQQQRWEGEQTGIEITEYMCDEGSAVVIEECAALLSIIETPIDGPAFVFVRRFSFDKNISQYHHLIGLMAMQAKLNIMGIVASEDSVFRELNIFGDLISNGYERGRFAINEFEQDARVERPTGDIPQMVWQQLDRVERQLRIGANYDQSQDGISPTQYGTGQSVLRLQGAMNENIAEYHLANRHGVERVDAKRLEWADKHWAAQRVKVFDLASNKQTYRPSTDINGGYASRRIYGAMAGWDDTVKAAVGLQYKGAGVMSAEIIQENIDGMEDVALVNDQIAARNAQDALFARLAARSEGDPRGDAALVEVMVDPSNREKILKKYFAPEEVEGQGDDMAALAQMQQQAGMENAAVESLPREAASTVLSQVEVGGDVGGGVQTVGRP